MIVIGIDPGTGKSSPTGIVAIRPDTKEILHAETIRPRQPTPTLHYKLRDLAEQLTDILKALSEHGEDHVIVGCETFVMRGKGGETLHRLIGAYIASTPFEYVFKEVFNTTVKRVVGGRGDADKQTVGTGVHKWFEGNDDSRRQVGLLVARRNYDLLDAFAIAITAYLELQATTK